jgi:magnesium and cobalt transporter
MTNSSNDEKHLNKPRSWLERLTAFIGREPQNKDQLMEVLRDAEDRDVLSAEMLSMIERILHVSEMQVREIMVPKAQMIVLQKDYTLKDILPIVIESAHSRFPVVDQTGNQIIGIVLAKDLLKYFFNLADKQFILSDIIRPAVFTPQSKRLNILLREFRINRNHIAIVADEYGHVAGLVTIEDVLEQIVGEIEDEYDVDEDDIHIKLLEDGSSIVKANTLIEEFNEHFNTNFSEEEFDTIGGIILKQFGHLPKRGEKIKFNNFRFKVLQGDNRRIYLLEVKPLKAKTT